MLKLVPPWGWLLLALVVSLTGNWFQLKSGLIAESQHAAAIEKAKLEGRVEALAERADALDLQGRLLAVDAQQLLDNLTQINANEDAQLATWRGFVRRLPPLSAGCGPGQGRVDAFNSTMRGDP